jgi:hypothetical protein
MDGQTVRLAELKHRLNLLRRDGRFPLSVRDQPGRQRPLRQQHIHRGVTVHPYVSDHHIPLAQVGHLDEVEQRAGERRLRHGRCSGRFAGEGQGKGGDIDRAGAGYRRAAGECRGRNTPWWTSTLTRRRCCRQSRAQSSAHVIVPSITGILAL